MSTRCYRGRSRRPVQTTLGKAPPSTDSDPIDLSHLRKPMETSVYGLSHVLKLFETATDEVRRYISFECDIIYECRACRTLFRSLGNFILHKRCYCQEVFKPSPVDYEESDAEISFIDQKGQSGSSDSDVTRKQPKTIETVLKKLSEKQENLNISNEIAQKVLLKEKKTEDIVKVGNKLNLERIESTTNGVFQTLSKPSVGNELIKSEVMEIHSILNNNEAILGSDGKLFTFDTDSEKRHIAIKKLHCPLCKLKFSTKKTLTFHIKYKHTETRLVYMCPECKDTFANAWCVFRHLYKVHRKNTSQIRRLRDYVHSSAVVSKQDGFKKKENLTGDDIDRESQWTSGMDGDQTCAGCGKRFERKAALHAHSQLCTKKMPTCNNPKDNKRNLEEKSPKQKTVGSGKGSDKRKSTLVRRMVKKTNVEINNQEEIGEVVANTTMENIILQSGDEDTFGFSKHNSFPKNENDGKEIRTIPTTEIECINIEDDSNDSTTYKTETITKVGKPEEITVEVISPDVINLDAITEDSSDSVELIEVKPDDVNFEQNLQSNIKKPTNDTPITPSKETDSQEISGESSGSQRSSSETEGSSSWRKMKKRKRSDDITSLRVKSQSYISWENSKCNSCDLKFTSHYYLMKHMALHFNWQRFQCSRCMFTCYDKMVCVRHVQSEHKIDQKILDNFVVALETVASAELSSDFTPIDLEKYCSESNGAKHGLDLTEIVVEAKKVLKEQKSSKELDKQDPMVRKMIMEVIFGSDVQGSFGNSSTSTVTRPARNRTSVKQLQTDFVYDMNETDSEMDDVRVKPIKIVKNNEFDFTVVKDELKKKKS